MKTTAIYLKIPLRLSKLIDELIIKEGYASKQEFIREIIRNVVVQRKKEEFHKTLEELRKKAKFRGSPILTKSEKNKIIKEYAKEKGF